MFQKEFETTIELNDTKEADKIEICGRIAEANVAK